jgi:hypothetical protein
MQRGSRQGKAKQRIEDDGLMITKRGLRAREKSRFVVIARVARGARDSDDGGAQSAAAAHVFFYHLLLASWANIHYALYLGRHCSLATNRAAV